MSHANRSTRPADLKFPERLENSLANAAPSPEDYALAGAEPPHSTSPTEVAAEAIRSGILPRARRAEIPGEDAILRSGDPDVDPLSNEYNGEEIPGASNPSPDRNDVDEIGRAYGMTEQDESTLRSTEEILEQRDARRWDAERKDPQ